MTVTFLRKPVRNSGEIAGRCPKKAVNSEALTGSGAVRLNGRIPAGHALVFARCGKSTGKFCRAARQNLPCSSKKSAALGRICRHSEVVFDAYCCPEMQQSARKLAVFLVDGKGKAGHDLKKFSLGEEFFGEPSRPRKTKAPKESRAQPDRCGQPRRMAERAGISSSVVQCRKAGRFESG
ncbi:hypothetical protein [Roseibium aggregatum]|uniref:hypothetical protein n=1 Tax=Roseibium aggregatum TaxID=187304 RepID=UPI0012F4C221|nr:hypothetical protein [Roseibium aggregatum]